MPRRPQSHIDHHAAARWLCGGPVRDMPLAQRLIRHFVATGHWREVSRDGVVGFDLADLNAWLVWWHSPSSDLAQPPFASRRAA